VAWRGGSIGTSFFGPKNVSGKILELLGENADKESR